MAADGTQLAMGQVGPLTTQANRAMLIEPPSLLITDDDPGFRETLAVVFQPRGFRTLLAGDGEEALRIVHRERVDLVLLDMHMPKLTGLETLRQLKEFRAMLPCILLSAQLDDRIVEQAGVPTPTRSSPRRSRSARSRASCSKRSSERTSGTDEAAGRTETPVTGIIVIANS